MRPQTVRFIELREQVLRRVQELLVEQLSVPRRPDEIDPDAPLFSTGIGLDSVDAIELIVAVETEFDLRLPEGDELPSVSRSVNRIVDFVVAHRLASTPSGQLR